MAGAPNHHLASLALNPCCSDVGFSRLMSRTHLSVEGFFGTWDWAAPEVRGGAGTAPL